MTLENQAPATVRDGVRPACMKHVPGQAVDSSLMKTIMRTVGTGLLCLLSCLAALPAVAQIYKYQDAEGRWHFTDQPEPGAVITGAQEASDGKAREIPDLEARLLDRFKPASAIERASLAVIAIDTPLVQGSGFFITEHGHILTNKHVVKPAETKEWKAKEENLKAADEAYRDADRTLRRERARLDSMKKSLKEYKKAIDRADDDRAKRVAEAEYRMFMDRYRDHEREFRDVKREYTRSKRQYERARREFNILSSTSILAKNFRIILKDDSEVSARLLSVSDEHDLALLKLDNYKTPCISPLDPGALRHGMKVFAIGSPLGMKDVITSGIVAGIRDENVITDATILPGSSGGPLLTQDGKVIGVNSARVSQVLGGEGFGVAVSIDTALAEFADQLGSD